MSAADDLQPLVARIRAGSCSSTDLDALHKAVQGGRLTVATGKRSLALGGSADGAVIVIGDNNIVVPPSAAELLAALRHAGSAVMGESRLYNRYRMLEKVRSIWIDGRHGLLKESLFGDTRVLLGLSEYPNAAVPPLEPLVRRPDQEQPLSPGTRLVDVFDEVGGQALLILGQPGAGKTTELLKLTDVLLERAANDEIHPIPVVFPLSTWAKTCRPLVEWLVDELSRTDGSYCIGRKNAEDWVDRDQILPMLDGLDEVNAEHREGCVRAINEFHHTHGLLPLVVCSRTVDYQVLSVPLPTQHAYIVQPLARSQVETYLADLDLAGRAVLQALEEDPSIWELLDTPLMLWVVIATYAGDSDARPCPGGSRDERRDHLFAAYVDRVLHHRYVDRMGLSREGESKRRIATADDEGGHRSGRLYSRSHTIHWLGWLAHQMLKHRQDTFHLEGLQYDWLSETQQKSMEEWFPWIGGLIGCLIGGLGFGFMGLQDGRLHAVVICVLIGALCYGVFGLMTGGRVHVLVFGLGMGSVMGLSMGLSMGLIGGPPLGLVVGMLFVSIGWMSGLGAMYSRRGIDNLSIIECAESFSWSRPTFYEVSEVSPILWTGFVIVCLLGGGLVSGLEFHPFLWLLVVFVAYYMGLFIGLDVCRWLSTREIEIEKREVPNQGIHRSARNALVVGLVIGVGGGLVLGLVIGSLLGLVGGLVGRPGSGMFVGLFVGLVVGLVASVFAVFKAGGEACLRHFVLRFLLVRSGVIPWNYAKFLNYAAERILLRKVGGGYTIHRMLLDYFAARYDESLVTRHLRSETPTEGTSCMPHRDVP
jgi:eukaryotic-like serine/threonine-protein kinase